MMTKTTSSALSILNIFLLVSCPNARGDQPEEPNSYREFREMRFRDKSLRDDFAYFSEEDSSELMNTQEAMDVVLAKMREHGVRAGEFVRSDFVAGGVNLADYAMHHPPFLLYEDFDISEEIGNRSILKWKELMTIRRNLKRPSLSYYVDKVARKRHFAELGIPQPHTHAVHYRDELSSTGLKADETRSILSKIPTEHGFCAKPTHMSLSSGNWLVDIDAETTKFSTDVRRPSNENFRPEICADSLAEGLHRGPDPIESWALKNVQPGIVIEDLFADQRDPRNPPNEFNMFVIWGKLYAAQWNFFGGEDGKQAFNSGFFDRDGHQQCPAYHFGDLKELPDGLKKLPDWVPWRRLVTWAEHLGRNKDMIRVDIFVGVNKRNASKNSPIQIAVSESEIHPTTMFCNPLLADEMARLWVAGYKIGNYKVIPNDEIPAGYVVDQKHRKRALLLRESQHARIGRIQSDSSSSSKKQAETNPSLTNKGSSRVGLKEKNKAETMTM